MSAVLQSRRSPVQIAVDDLMLERIRPVSLVIGVVFIGYVVFDLLFLQRPDSYYGAGIAAGVAISFFGVHQLNVKGKIHSDYADRVAAFLSLSALASAFPLMTILHDGHLSVNLLLVLFASSLLITSRLWFGVVGATIGVGWATFLLAEPGSVSPHYSAALYVGILLSMFMNEFNRRAMYRLVSLRMEAQQQTEALVKASRETQAANALVHAVFQGATDPIYVKDVQGRYVMVNPAYLRDFGRPSSELIGHTASEVFGEEEGRNVADVEQAVRESGKSVMVEEYVSRIGQTYLSSIFPYVDGTDQGAGIIGISRNISLRKHHEEELARLVSQLAAAKAEADEATRVKSDFLATMSHEIRTPMNGVLGMAELLRDTPLSAEQKEYADTISESAEALLGIINDILDLSKIEAGKMTVETVPFALADRLRSAVHLVEHRAKSKALDLRLELPPDLPPVVLGDPTRIGQIVLNLLSNAVKFTKHGRITLRATCVPETSDRIRLRLAVEDTGIGIAPDKLDTVFEKFAQAESATTRQFGGTGLGLPICRELATLMGGVVGVQSKPGTGSTFWLELPVRIAAQTAGSPERSALSAPVGSAPANTRGLRVLLVEDNVINQKVALSMLERMGCHAQYVDNGARAIAMALNNAYDLILMDVEMPDITGPEATQQILRKMGATAPPIIAVTAHRGATHLQQCLDAGMKECLTKPLDVGELRQAVARVARKPSVDSEKPVAFSQTGLTDSGTQN